MPAPTAPAASTVLAIWDAGEEEWVVLPVAIGGHRVTAEPLTVEAERTVLGSVVSAISDDRGHVERVDVELSDVDTEDADAYEALLGTGLTLWAAGKAVGPDVVAVVCSAPERTPYVTLHYAALSFTVYITEPDEE
jgi:hypothetical protein